MKKFIIPTVAILLISGCKSVGNQTAKVVSAQPVEKGQTASDAEFFTAVNKNSNFQQVKISSKIKVEMGSYTPPADATIYIENGQKIWMNLGVLFVNIARGIATPAGIQGYVNLNKTYIDSDFTYLNKMLGVDFINYSALQNLLVGKPTVPISATDFKLAKNGSGYTLNSITPQKTSVKERTAEYNISLSFSNNFNLEQLILKDTKSADQVEINYTNWIATGTEQFPQNVKIILKGEKSGQILIENTTFDFEKMETPYIVPSNYTKKEIK